MDLQHEQKFIKGSDKEKFEFHILEAENGLNERNKVKIYDQRIDKTRVTEQFNVNENKKYIYKTRRISMSLLLPFFCVFYSNLLVRHGRGQIIKEHGDFKFVIPANRLNSKEQTRMKMRREIS